MFRRLAVIALTAVVLAGCSSFGETPSSAPPQPVIAAPGPAVTGSAPATRSAAPSAA